MVNWGEDSRLHLLRFNGKQLLPPFRVDLPRYLLRSEQVDAFLSTFSEGTRWHDLTRPEYWPVVQRILVDDENKIWVFG